MKTALYILAVIFMFVSCSKINFENYRKNPGIDFRFCNIKTWTAIQGDEHHTKIFTYDDNENPVKVTSDHSGTGSGQHLFFYDSLQRLIKYEYEFVHTKFYHYEGSSRRADNARVTDVLGRELLETYTYDEKGRIIKSVLELVSSPIEDDEYPTATKEYIYLNDDISSILFNGVQQNADVEYSNKPSIYMTNKVWQFVNQNYGRHAVTNAGTYNRLGLPLTFQEEKYEFPFLDIVVPGSSLTYYCE